MPGSVKKEIQKFHDKGWRKHWCESSGGGLYKKVLGVGGLGNWSRVVQGKGGVGGQCFSWKLLNSRLPTLERMHAMFPTSYACPTCPLPSCRQNETTEHPFKCPTIQLRRRSEIIAYAVKDVVKAVHAWNSSTLSASCMQELHELINEMFFERGLLIGTSVCWPSM